MFVIEKGSYFKVTHGQLQKVMLDFDSNGNIISGDVQFYEGYLDDDNNFVPLGLDHIHMGSEMAKWYQAYQASESGSVYTEDYLSNVRKIVNEEVDQEVI